MLNRKRIRLILLDSKNTVITDYNNLKLHIFTKEQVGQLHTKVYVLSLYVGMLH